MASSKKAIDDTLEVVKDLEKFKGRIKELADAQAAADASVEKAKAKNKETFAEMDAKVAMAEDDLASVRARVASAEKDAQDAMKPVKQAQGEVNKAWSEFAKREAKLIDDQNAVDAEKVKCIDDRMVFQATVKRFKEGVAALTSAI
jgi:chromosome segregation ATPase